MSDSIGEGRDLILKQNLSSKHKFIVLNFATSVKTVQVAPVTEPKYVT